MKSKNIFLLLFFVLKIKSQVIFQDTIILKQNIIDKEICIDINKVLKGINCDYEESEAYFYYEPLFALIKGDTLIFSNINIGLDYLTYYYDYLSEKLFPPLNKEIIENYYLRKFKVINKGDYSYFSNNLKIDLRFRNARSFIDLALEIIDVKESESNRNLKKLIRQKNNVISKIKKGVLEDKDIFIFPNIIIGIEKDKFIKNFPPEIRDKLNNIEVFININPSLVEKVKKRINTETCCKCWIDVLILEFKEEKLVRVKFKKILD